MKQKISEITVYIEQITLLVLAVLFFAFPIAFSTMTIEPFMVTKVALLGAVSLLSLLLFGARLISEGTVRIRRTPFDVPFGVFVLVLFLTAVVSVNRYDALMSFVPILFAYIIFFVTVNVARNKSAVVFLLGAAGLGAALTSIVTVLALTNKVFLPFTFAKTQTFTPLGSLLDQVIYFGAILATLGMLVEPWVSAKLNINESSKSGSVFGDKKETNDAKGIYFSVVSVIITIGFIVTIYDLMVLQKPVLLPFDTGFQTAFASISQDSGRLLQGFLFGSGFGTYGVDFAKFRLPAFNLNQTLWFVPFPHSSSFVLELLATTGMVGVAAFLFLVVSLSRYVLRVDVVRKNPVAVGVVFLLAIAFVLPLSFTTYTLLFLLIALLAASLGTTDTRHFFDVELAFVAFRKTFMPFSIAPVSEENGVIERVSQNHNEQQSLTRLLPVGFAIVFLLLTGILGFFTATYVISDVIFQRSLAAVAANNGLETYNNQTLAIRTFPYRDSFFRIYSQVNLSLANSLASNQPAGKQPSAEVQQTITTLIQQSIQAARSATAVAPQTSANWENYSSIYRSLIGFGQNADQFAILAEQQAIALDPSNPQIYISLGGIYYQLRQWDNAQNQFQIAARLKPDFANAYYNLGHALEQKGDFQNAMAQYQNVKALMASDKENVKKIDEEIAALQQKIQSGQLTDSSEQAAASQSAQATTGTTNQPPLEINQPATQLPAQKKPLVLPSPAATVTPTPIQSGQAPSPSAAPSTAPSPTQ